MKVGKHVIFLGAGASCGSGFPLANELRLLISSQSHLKEAVVNYSLKHNYTHGELFEELNCCWKRNERAIELFRNGGFATVDEFCKLAGGCGFKKEINGVRRLIRGVLGICNPEENFHKSEYYSFVQGLFNDDLLHLRDDISVLTYNYDVYLDFLLQRALLHRWKVAGVGYDVHKINSVTSGLRERSNHEWLKSDVEKRSFCLLKLHGAICYPDDKQPINFATLFSETPLSRAEKLFSHHADAYEPPVLFPWEVMREGGFISEEAFPLAGDSLTYSLFQGVWERARREVQTASKISFVGLSMHSFLKDGLRFLFEGKANRTEVVIVNPENTVFESDNPKSHWSRQPWSPASSLSNVFSEIAPKMRRIGKNPGLSADGEFTIIKDFREFIKTQMKPAPSLAE
ncbi:MAG: hypothetical protein JWM68_1158 [Verrucomicrobiales bacterium]|nr:hypothetical protein [Verrucomicrobiales bacterium]